MFVRGGYIMKRRSLISVLLALFMFSLLLTGAAQAGAGWDYYKEITIDHTQVSGDQLTSFPVLISIHGDTDLIAAQDDGDDIIFTNGNNTQKYNHQIERYIGSSGSASMVAMVMIPTLSGTTDTVIRMWYGNGTCTSQQNPEAVWDSNFMAVFHLNETSEGGGSYDDHYDSTANNNDGELGSAPQMNPDAIGKIDGSVDFEGTGESYIETTDSNSLDITGSITMEAWTKMDELPNTAKGVSLLICKRERIDKGYCMGITKDGEVQAGIGDQFHFTSGMNLQINTWYHIVSVYEETNSGTVTIYINGNPELVEYTSGTLSATAEEMRIGSCSYDAPCSKQLDGIIDEVRISNTARSSGWVITSFNNQNNPSGFYTIGAQNGAGPEQPVPELETITLVSLGIFIVSGGLGLFYWRKRRLYRLTSSPA